MKLLPGFVSALACLTAAPAYSQAPQPATPVYPRPLVELNTSYFPFHDIGAITPDTWAARKKDIRDRVLLAAGLYPLPAKSPLKPVVHGRVERDDYTIDRVFFESFPGHYVTGSLYLPKQAPKDGKMPGILSAHGHWTNARFLDNGAGTPATKQQLAIGAERWESGSRTPLHARCVQLARMGCAVFFYDMEGYADAIQLPDHRSPPRASLSGKDPGTFGLGSAAAELRLQSNFGLQTWNTIRALDFLLTVAGVDPSRIAITGESGGATQTMMLATIDDRVAAAFPCVMVSTAMQGGCTCENACYLRINQGNIDIGAAFAPKPMGLTAANDWTKELEQKGWPDLKNVWAKLGAPKNLMATFNTHWQHNYNHVSRTTMYGFMNQHFKLGLVEPVLEREFVVSKPEELTVWTGAHPKPAGERVGASHETALLKQWADENERAIGSSNDVLARAWDIMIGRPRLAPDDVQLEQGNREDRGDYSAYQGTVLVTKHGETVPYVFFRPNGDKWKGTIVLWLAERGEGMSAEGKPGAAVQKLLDAGLAVACPRLYFSGAKEQPMNPPRSRDLERNPWQSAAAYTYGYNHSLVMHRVHDTMAAVAGIEREAKDRPLRVILAGTDGGGVVAAAAAVALKGKFAGAVIDTEGFRFASLSDIKQPLFVPGAVKYGDVPALLRLGGSVQPVILGENGAKGGADAVAAAVLRLAAGR
ncbi:MAG TPA: hypothetical protein VM029_20650 [Opitutaceae bacterium]|nr:hypothetical protein [Opitutaceae bacterium]